MTTHQDDVLHDDRLLPYSEGPARIVVCGVVYAPNLGDGVIADCMAHVIKQYWPGTPVEHLDLSTRESFGEVAVGGKRVILALLRSSPRVVNKLIVSLGLKIFLRRKALPAWKNYFRSSDLVLIGGGHLLSDFNLNFPSKLELLSRLASGAGARLTVHAVGVSSHWSAPATRLFGRVLARCSGISVRDEQSGANLKRHLPQLAFTPTISYDPGYLAQRQYAHVVAKGQGVGLNLSHPDELAEYGAVAETRPDYDGFWLALLRTYLNRGSSVTLFTNGAEEDEEYLDRIANKAAAGGLSGFDRAVRPRTPDELVALIKGLDILIGHRLHAQIIAFAHGIPTVALGWDAKLQSQMEMMGRGEFLQPFARPDADQVLSLADRAARVLVDDARISDLAQRAEQDLVSAITSLAGR